MHVPECTDKHEPSLIKGTDCTPNALHFPNRQPWSLTDGKRLYGMRGCAGEVAPLGLLHDLRRHPAGRADKGVAGHLLIAPGAAAFHGSSHTKICQHHLARAVYEDVASLQQATPT